MENHQSLRITLRVKFDPHLWWEFVDTTPTTQLKLFEHCWLSWADANSDHHVHSVKFKSHIRLEKNFVYDHLPQLACWLRTQHWAAYHFVQRDGELIPHHPHKGIDYRPQGLVFGTYCARLTEWRLTHT